MFSGIGQLLLDPLYDLPEGRSLDGVRVPARPHNLIHVVGSKLRSVHPVSFFYHFVELGIHGHPRVRAIP